MVNREIKFRAWVQEKNNPVFDKAYKAKEAKYSDHFDNYNGNEEFNNFDEWYKAQEDYFDEILPKNWVKGIIYTDKIVFDGIALFNGVRSRSSDIEKIYNIMQYTGLKDKNGKEIYEGDIIEKQNGEKMLISYSEQDLGFICSYISSNDLSYSLCYLKGYKEFKIIGNIHENPELLNNK